MTEEIEKRRKDIEEHYKSRCDELERKSFANNENYEKYLIAVATVFIGIWLTVGKEILIQKIWLNQCWFLVSGGLFIATLVSAITAILVSNHGIKVEKKWIKDDCDAYIGMKKRPNEKEPNRYADSVPCLNKLSGFLFIAGLVSFFVFIAINILSLNNTKVAETQHTNTKNVYEISLSKPLINESEIPKLSILSVYQ